MGLMARFSKWFPFILSALLVAAPSCSSQKKGATYEIGIDPSWYPLPLAGQERNVFAFLIELLVEIAQNQGIELSVGIANWDNLLDGLEKNQYAAALSSLRPYVFNQDLFSFSSLTLQTGPVLVVREESPIKGIYDLYGKEISVVEGSPSIGLLQTAPGVILKRVESPSLALLAVDTNVVSGAIVPALLAESYIRDLYLGQLRVASPPLNDEGLRLITRKGINPELLKKFDQGLAWAKETGLYADLQKKWRL